MLSNFLEKEDKRVKLRLLAGVALFLAVGCALMEPVEIREEKFGKAIPRISDSFASPKLSPGEIWKVYIKASDPDGDMKYIVCTIEQQGRGSYPVSRIRISPDQRRELSGNVYLTTENSLGRLDNVTLKLILQVQDEAGHFSEPVNLFLLFQSKAKQEAPTQGIFQNRDLGPIMIRLEPSGEGAGAL